MKGVLKLVKESSLLESFKYVKGICLKITIKNVIL